MSWYTLFGLLTTREKNIVKEDNLNKSFIFNDLIFYTYLQIFKPVSLTFFHNCMEILATIRGLPQDHPADLINYVFVAFDIIDYRIIVHMS